MRLMSGHNASADTWAHSHPGSWVSGWVSVGWTMRMNFSSWMVIGAITLCVAHTAAAQDSRGRSAAAAAYDRGTENYMNGDYAAAAEWFETAHRLAPAPAALMQAIRAHHNGQHFARAATLAHILQTDYPGEAQAVGYAEQILTETAPNLLRVDVECSDCEIDLDDAVQQGRTFYVEPDTHHTVIAHFSTGDVSRDVSGSAGDTTTLDVTAPEAQVETAETPEAEPTTQSDGASEGLPPVVTFVAAGVTGAVLVTTIVSWVMMNGSVDEYEKAAAKASGPGGTDADYAAAKKLLDEASGQTRTNVLIGATAVCAVATGVIAFALTDWSSGDDTSTTAAVVPTADGVMGFLKGSF